MIEQLSRHSATTTPAAERLQVEPFLHFGVDRIYNTMTDRHLAQGEPGFSALVDLRAGRAAAADLEAPLRAALFAQGWLVETAADLSSR